MTAPSPFARPGFAPGSAGRPDRGPLPLFPTPSVKAVINLLAACWAIGGGARLAADAADPGVQVTVAWDQPIGPAAIPSLGVVPNPLQRPGSRIRPCALAELRDLHAEAVRYLAYCPYPRLAVAELLPPEGGRTSWDFSLIDPLVDDFMAAQAGRSVIMDFGTIPAWMFATSAPKRIPDDPNETAWSYGGAFEPEDLRDQSLREVADYYARLASWYTRGYFIDELGHRHNSGHHYKFAYWEVQNEPDIEHAGRGTDAGYFDPANARRYTRRYDAIVRAVRPVLPATKFVGAALAHTATQAPFFAYFLDPKNHQPGVPLDVLSFHFYAKPPAGLGPSASCGVVFAQADGFLNCVSYLEILRRHLSPGTRLAADELGLVLPGDFQQFYAPKGADVSYPIPADYWNLNGALFAYLYARLSVLGVDIASVSQLVGFPSQFPSVSLIDWNTGRGNARLQVLKLLVRDFPAGTQAVETKVTAPHALFPPDSVSALGLLGRAGERRLLLVNKTSEPVPIALGLGAATVEAIDRTTGATVQTKAYPKLAGFTLEGFGVAVVQLTPPRD